jgi:hypothetical protein
MKNSNKGKANLFSASLLLLASLMAIFCTGQPFLPFHLSTFCLQQDSTPKKSVPKPPAKKQNYPLPADTAQNKTLKTTAPVLLNDTNPISLFDTLRNKMPGRATDTSITTTQVDTFNVKISKDSLDAPVYYHADDSMVLDVPANKIILYGKNPVPNTRIMN